MRVRLTSADLHELLENPSPDNRAQIAEAVAEGVKQRTLSDAEMSIARQILKILVADTAAQVRQAIADALFDSPEIPPEIASSLARDIEQIAVPVLENSPVFSDAELIQIVLEGTGPKQLAVARRRKVSGAVSEALVEAGNGTVVATLLGNQGAQILPLTFDRIVDRFGADPIVQEPLVRRQDMPVAVAERLVSLVAGHLRTELLKCREAPAEILERAVGEGREETTAELALNARSNEDLAALVAQLHGAGRLTPTLILRSAFLGNMRFVEEAMARLAGVDHAKAWVLIHDRGPLGLRAIFSETGLPPVLFPAMRVAVDVFHELAYDEGLHDRERFAERMLERVLTQYQSVDPEDLSFFLGRLEKLAQTRKLPLEVRQSA